MAQRKFKTSKKSQIARAELIKMSQTAQDIIKLEKATTGEGRSVNEVVLEMHKEESGCSDYRRFDQWREAGYKVKKGASAYRVWGSPIKAKKAAGSEDFAEIVEGSTEEETAEKYKYWPMCCLFNESQVEPMGPNDGPKSKQAKDDEGEAPNDEGGEVVASPFVKANYSDDLEQRREYRAERAEKAEKDAHSLATTARRMGQVIPFGQPIHIGHHSERRDRNYRRRVAAKMEKAAEAFGKAAHHKGKAETVGTGGIASDDPEALQKLRDQLTEREREQTKMKAANKAIRAGNDEALKALGFSTPQIDELKTPNFGGMVGFASFELSNNNAQIRRLKGRIAELEALYKSEPIEHESESFSVEVLEGRVVFDFGSTKPNEQARHIMKRRAFKFSRRMGKVWTRKATHNGLGAAREAIAQLEALETIY